MNLLPYLHKLDRHDKTLVLRVMNAVNKLDTLFLAYTNKYHPDMLPFLDRDAVIRGIKRLRDYYFEQDTCEKLNKLLAKLEAEP